MDDLHTFYPTHDHQYLTHDFHPYPHKISPSIAKILIETYSQVGDTVLDCFCGSGTALLEANLSGRNALGIDSNPLACLIANVKTTPIDSEILKKAIKHFMSEVHHHLKRDGTLLDYVERIHPKIPEFKNKDIWFCKKALLGLSLIKALLKNITDEDIRNFCLVAFSSLIKEVSHATSFYRLTKAKRPRTISLYGLAHLFHCRLLEMSRKMISYHEKKSPCSVKILQQDVRHVNLEKVDFIIANFPKFNMDFERCFKIYSWWLDFDVKKVNENTIGTLKRKEEYYKDISLVLENMQGMLKTRKHCAFLITDSYDKGKHMDHGKVVKQLAETRGFLLKDHIVRTIPKKVLPFVAKDRREDIFIFKKATFK
jgi:hypothetical protein